MADVRWARQAEGPRVEFRLLGPLEVLLGGQPIELGGAKPRALLADLLLHLGQVVSADRLIDDLWGEQPPGTAGHAVEVYVSQLRKALDPARRDGDPRRILVTSQPGYLLDVEPEQVDVHRFRRLVDDGRGAVLERDHARGAVVLREALALWRGPAIADFT